MAKFIKSFLIIVCILSIIIAGCEEPDGGCNIAWTLCWLAAATFFALCAIGIKTKQ